MKLLRGGHSLLKHLEYNIPPKGGPHSGHIQEQLEDAISLRTLAGLLGDSLEWVAHLKIHGDGLPEMPYPFLMWNG